MTRKLLLLALLVTLLGLNAMAQGNNTRMGGDENDDQESLAERIFKLEKKTDAFNFHINFASSLVAEDANHGEWDSKFVCRDLRLDIKGDITPKVFYRIRHRFNSNQTAKGLDRFAKATDIMMVGYRPSSKVDIAAGKLCQIWGGFEYDQNPMEIYRYSDLIDMMDIFMAGAMVSYRPVPTQEVAFQMTNSYNGAFTEDLGEDPQIVTSDLQQPEKLSRSRAPFTYILNWNGNFLQDQLQTRWAWGIQTQAKHKYSRMITLGQRLNLQDFQLYFDYFGEWDDVDRLHYATTDLQDMIAPGSTHLGKVHSHTFIAKMNWQFAPKWNLMLKGTYETTSIAKIADLHNYRKSIGYLGSIEFWPMPKKLDFRVFLAYLGHKYDFNKACGLEDYNTNRVELGFMYRIKCY